MKELSIEEKAKRYDEALKVLHKYDGANIMFSQSLKEEMFPELAESEDEMTRREIISALKFANVKGVYDKHIAWLEKQGNNMGISESTKKKLVDNLNKALEKETPEFWNKFLDEQGEQILDNSTKTCNDDQNLKHFELKAGHWYICHRAFCCRADHLTIKEGERFMCEEDGIVKGFVIKDPEKYFKEVCAPAPIEDEQKPVDKVEPKFKIGDYIISNNNSEIIYHITGTGINELGNSDYVCEHVGREKEYNGRIYNMSQDKVDANFRLWTIQDAKDGDVLAWDDSKCIALFKNIYDEESFNSYGLVGHCTGTFELRQSYHDIEGAHPATKEQRDLLFQKMKEAGYEWDAEKKELKMPTEWSEEDEIYISDVLWCVEQARKVAKDENAMGTTWCAERWLKSLKPRNRWKPSDEQIDALEDAIADAVSSIQKNMLNSLYSDLKKLREE